MIQRKAEKTLKKLARGYPIVAVTGPRQSGKTTLVKKVFPEIPYVTLEEPDILNMAISDPRGFLGRYPDGAIFDEVQRCPELFSYLQTRVDTDKTMGQFILTGSQQFGLLSGITQTLAGRVGLVQLLPFSIDELRNASLGYKSLKDVLYHGLYPPLYDCSLTSRQWYADYIMTYIERDVRKLINIRDLAVFQLFVKMCAARVGQLINLAGLASDCGISHNTARSWLSILEASYIVFLLQPHFSNFGKRLVKTPKIYFYDSGLATALLNIQNPDHLLIHPQRGGLFEGLVISELKKALFNDARSSNLYFWRTNHGDEIDVVIDQGTNLLGIEIKSGETINQDFFKGLIKWQKISGQPYQNVHLVYGGNESFKHQGIGILSWKDATKLFDFAT